MSVNKDLEIIKQNEPYRRIDFEDYKVGFDSIKWRAVIEAAERMAKDIEDARKMSLNWQNRYTNILIEKNKVEEELVRLKAEIEKREEVVRCEDCIWNDGACDQEINYSAIDEVDLLSYCSAGQRRESEEGK